MKFRLTYDIVVVDSYAASNGEYSYNGFVTREGNTPLKRNYIPKRPSEFRLRDAINLLLNRASDGPVCADSCPVNQACPPRWFNYGGSIKNGQSITLALHLPESLTNSTRIRIARLLKCYGLPKKAT